MGRGIHQLSLTLPAEARSVPLCRRALRLLLAELGIAGEPAAAIELVLSEAAGNVIRHAYEQPGESYRVEVEVSPAGVRLVVIDMGQGFDRTAIAAPSETAEDGRGLWLIEQLAAVATFQPAAGGGCHLEAHFPLTPSRP